MSACQQSRIPEPLIVLYPIYFFRCKSFAFPFTGLPPFTLSSTIVLKSPGHARSNTSLHSTPLILDSLHISDVIGAGYKIMQEKA
jgi:hypothetical protein